MKLRDLFTTILNKTESGQDTVLVTIAAETGSSPRSAGAHMLCAGEGRVWGTIGGGTLEYRALELAGELLARRQSGWERYRLRPNDEEDLGMLCGGDVEVWFHFIPGGDRDTMRLVEELLRRLERDEDTWLFADLGGSADWTLYSAGQVPEGLSGDEIRALARNRPVLLNSGGRRLYGEPLNFAGKVFIFGGGHVAQALAPLLDGVDFRCVIFDNREEFVGPERFPTAYRLVTGDYNNIAHSVEVGPRDYLVIMTHAFDIPVLRQLINKDWAYLGLIGSRGKIAAVKQRLSSEGVDGKKLDRLSAPIGMRIHSETPAEIAISIAGELILRRAEMRERLGDAPRINRSGS
ncbi:MAG: XdhC family protein [Treponema sp.]|jgi:xanthine dehydrogenase accessory factor|nr:XdhC family protein [Treponema sp.]